MLAPEKIAELQALLKPRTRAAERIAQAMGAWIRADYPWVHLAPPELPEHYWGA